jgi:hypothetical protein
MAANGGDARSKRAQARNDRRSRSSQQEQGQEQEQEQQGQDGGANGGGQGGGKLSTPKLVAAGAAAGALLGTAKAVRDRRHGHDAEPEAGDEQHDEYDDHDEPRGRGGEQEHESAQPSGVRGLLATVLEAALEAVHEPTQARQDREGDDDERARDEEDEDEEAEREPRAEHGGGDAGRPAARGESGQAGRVEAEGGADDVASASGAGGDARADEAPEESPSGNAHGAEPIHARRNGRVGAAEIVARAREQVAALVGREPESTSRIEQVDGGWRLAVEVVEVPRIPPTTDVMASYSLALDESGKVLEYGRTHRYYRNRADGGDV